jgi:hypothetical protein
VNALSALRSTTYPVSFDALSAHARSIALAEAALALRPLGAAGAVAGGAWVVALAVLDQAEDAVPLTALTRYQ